MMSRPLITYLETMLKSARLPWVLLSLFSVCIIYSALQIALVFHKYDEFPARLPAVPSSLPVMVEVAKQHLFGEYERSLAELPATSLQLTLQGIAMGLNDSSGSRALIAAPKQPVSVYKIGDVVPGGAIIQQITRDRVILDDRGRYESLSLPLPEMAGTVAGAH